MSILKRAFSQYGVKEIAGNNHNPKILKYFSFIGHSWVNDDETAWCSAFVNWAAKKEGLNYSGKLNARSWMKVGEPTKTPVIGDIVVFWRDKPTSWKGHVGIYINSDKHFIYVLGGNQSNQVNIKAIRKNRLLGYRKLKKQ